MIKKISISKIASYGENPAVLQTDKRTNLIYGLNGSGKTVFSNFLNSRNNVDFSKCSIEGLTDEKLLVYNQTFIENNFYQKDVQKGIFTLSSENKEAEENIKNAEERIGIIKLQLKNDEQGTGIEVDLKKKKQEIISLQTIAETKTWEIKTKYTGGDRILEFCLEGKKGSQKALFNYILKLTKPDAKSIRTIDSLKKEAEATQGENAKIYDENEIKEIDFYLFEIEKNTLLQDVIVGNENLQIADLIKQLNNDDWVKQGISYIQEDSGDCPFCQKKTITDKLKEEIENYFDESYQNRVTELKKLDSEYFEAWQNIKDTKSELSKNDFIQNRKTEFELIHKSFTEKLSSNWSKISNKIKNPSTVVNLESTILEKDALNIFIKEIVEEIKAHNLKVENKEITKKEIIDTFWKIMRWDYDQTIDNYNSRSKVLKEEEDEIKNQISELNIDINEQKEIIKIEQKEIVNIDEAIANINNELKFLGADTFYITKAGEDSYRLQRSSESRMDFKTLSEGEKTIISFLYFLELCKGKESEEESFSEKIIVIDDPISSLSHIYIFNISQLIEKKILKRKYTQIFILTHSLYFFHEIWKYVKKEHRNLYRIYRNKDNSSQIRTLKPDEIQNDYQAYWQIIKDHNSGDAHDTLLANSMRNILEYFFGFINKQRFTEAITEIEEIAEYQFFIRYIQRESHSDLTNISDTTEIDPTLFKQAFKEIFIKSGYEEHYNKMIK